MTETAIKKETRTVEQYSDAELMAAFWAYFGHRGVGILGWCFVGSMSGTEDAAELRVLLQQRGLSKSALYNALDVLREFREHLEGQPLPRRDSSFAINLLKRLGTVSCL